MNKNQIWYFLREVLWTAVFAVVLLVASIASAFVGAGSVSIALGLGAITLALLSKQQN